MTSSAPKVDRVTQDGVRSSSNTALTAVALQDHLVRNLALNLSDPCVRPRVIHQRRQKPKPAKPVVNTRRPAETGKAPVAKETAKKKEYVLDPRPPPLTLAQKFGLVDGPKHVLSEDDWQKAKAASNKRDDSKQPCVICKEDFGSGDQVLLSCTHVFHKACIKAFEKFTGKKSCPMCRKEQYETRVIYEGAHHHRHKSATMFQALWRGYIVRCWYLKLRETMPPKDPGLRKKFFEKKLHDITERMLRSVDCDVDGFLKDLDRSLEASRDVFREFDDRTRIISEEGWEQLQLKAVERGDTDCPICLTPLETQGLVAPKVTSTLSTPSCGTNPRPTASTSTPRHKNREIKNTTSAKYQATRETAVRTTKSQGHMGQGQRAESQGQSMALVCQGQGHQKGKRSQVLLSCSHVFHLTCLEAFEDFSVGERYKVCPVCRSHYQKRVL